MKRKIRLSIVIALCLVGSFLCGVNYQPSIEAEGFISTGEVRNYIATVNITEREYSKLYDCDDFAMDMAAQAMKDGEDIGLALILKEKYGEIYKVHVTNFVIVGNNIYRLEPQTGVISNWEGRRITVD